MKKTLKINVEVLKVLTTNEVGQVRGGGSAAHPTDVGRVAPSGSVVPLLES